MLRFPPNDPSPIADLERRIAESSFLLAPKKIAALAAESFGDAQRDDG